MSKHYSRNNDTTLLCILTSGLPAFVLLWCVPLVSLLQASTDTQNNPAVCRIHNQLPRFGNVGSGTLVDVTADGTAGLVLTCAHLFREGTGEVVVEFSAGQTHGAKLVDVDTQADLAALMIQNPRVAPAEVSYEQTTQQTLRACGYGSRGRYRCAVGPVVGKAASPGQQSLLIADSVRSGDSGGGVFDERDRLVAVIWGTRDGVTYASAGQPLRRFLQRVLGKRTQLVGKCPGGNCPWPPQRAPRRKVLRPPAPPQPSPPAGNQKQPADREPQLQQLAQRISRLEQSQQEASDCVTHAELAEFVRRADFEEFTATVHKQHSLLVERFESFADCQAATADGPTDLFHKLNSPVGWALVAILTLGGWLIGHTRKQRNGGARGRRRRPFRRPPQADSTSTD